MIHPIANHTSARTSIFNFQTYLNTVSVLSLFGIYLCDQCFAFSANVARFLSAGFLDFFAFANALSGILFPGEIPKSLCKRPLWDGFIFIISSSLATQNFQ
jgi:hypothetical protein